MPQDRYLFVQSVRWKTLLKTTEIRGHDFLSWSVLYHKCLKKKNTDSARQILGGSRYTWIRYEIVFEVFLSKNRVNENEPFHTLDDLRYSTARHFKSISENPATYSTLDLTHPFEMRDLLFLLPLTEAFFQSLTRSKLSHIQIKLLIDQIQKRGTPQEKKQPPTNIPQLHCWI